MEFKELVRRAMDAFNKLSPAQQAEHREAQRQSWARGQIALGECERDRHVEEPKRE